VAWLSVPRNGKGRASVSRHKPPSFCSSLVTEEEFAWDCLPMRTRGIEAEEPRTYKTGSRYALILYA